MLFLREEQIRYLEIVCVYLYNCVLELTSKYTVNENHISYLWTRKYKKRGKQAEGKNKQTQNETHDVELELTATE